MERSLNLSHLREAIGDGPLFPSAEELQERLAQAEIALFLGAATIDDEVLATGWYLHAVGSARRELQLYPVERQLRAHQVSAHIFDLALSGQVDGNLEKRQLLFAAEVGYVRGGLNPNAAALYRRRPTNRPSLRDAPGEVALEVGSAMLALDRKSLYPRLDELRVQAGRLQLIVDVLDLFETPYGAAARVVEGCFELLVHLTYDRPDRLARARELFDSAVNPPHAESDLDSRWVAAHLRDIADDLGTTSVWAYRPPTVPPSAARAMTLGDPAVMSLWPPQLDLLKMTPSPLERAVRRLVMSFPTSAGKTLLAQYIIASHIASGGGSVCVVVPTHSLSRELQRDLSSRLSILGTEVEDAAALGLPLPTSGRVIVMTPEKFAAHMRNEPSRMLDEFSLFLIDEAHLVGDRERGWTLESAVSFLHAATRDTQHRIILLSAALGNRVHFGAWLGHGGESATTFHHEWKGPRRAHALFGTEADWNAATLEQPSRRGGLSRQHVPLYGTVHIRTGPNQHQALRTTEPIATLVRKRRGQGRWEKDNDRSDRLYRIRAQMATVLGSHGSVLIVEPTKQAAQRTASAVAEVLGEETAATAALVALATTRLGPGHPLIEPLRRGVGFHHSALPNDIQAELETGIRSGILRYLVATTTLIEGINFPVRSVLIGERGYRTGEGEVITLDAPKLLNAIGRAGRAGRETEGWVVLAINEPFTSASFELLTADDEELSARSLLDSATALDALATFEELQLAGEDAVMEVAGTAVSDFVSHVWFVANGLAELKLSSVSTMSAALESTLAWQQLSHQDRDRWTAVLDAAYSKFERTPAARRSRWARTGTSLKTASQLEIMAAEIRDAVPPGTSVLGAEEAWLLVSSGDRLPRLLGLSERTFRGFRPRRNSPASASLPVDIQALVASWLAGMDLGELGETYLGEISDDNYRYEQLSEFVSSDLEHFLPWVLSTLVAWVNENTVVGERVSSNLPAYVRYGVDSPTSLELAVGGVRSRRVVHAVAQVSPQPVDDLRAWLAQGDVVDWRDRLEASPSELADLLFFTRAQAAQITSRVLAGETVELPLVRSSAGSSGHALLRLVDEEEPARVGVYQGHHLVGVVGADLHDDVRRLVAIGIPLTVSVSGGNVQIRIDDPTSRSSWFG